MQDEQERIKELVETLNRAARAYEQEDREIISNLEYDRLYDELLALEEATGTVMANSPTARAGYEVLSNLPKFRHDSQMLSLDKTKDVEALENWIGDKEGILSWKMDGLTIVLTYRNGSLFRAVTRGNGEIGEVVTNNAKVFKNVPLKISYPGELVLRGEAVIRYSDFEEINTRIPEEAAKYKNPRNLCSGAVRQLNNQITAERNVNFYAFAIITMKDMVEGEPVDAPDTDGFSARSEQMEYLKKLRFETVEVRTTSKASIREDVKWFASRIEENDFPSDGLVLTLNDIAYGRALGRTSKFPRDSIAFKWTDEIKETKLTSVEWSASRTGLINPIAVFESVELEGTTVSRASLHNISIIEGLQLGIGDTISVYKANMIIPQLAENLTRSNTLEIPARCPVCDGPTRIAADNDVKVLICTNPDCIAKQIKSFAHFAARDAMNIEGLSEATVEKLISIKYVHSLTDLFRLERFQSEIETESRKKTAEKREEFKGLGEKSFQNLLDSVNKARKTTLAKFIYSLGIPNIGLSNAKLICKSFHNDFDAIRKAQPEDFLMIGGIGEVIAESFSSYFKKEANNQLIDDLMSELELEQEVIETTEKLGGKTFVITGSVEQFENRNALKAFIEQNGGKVTGSVTSKTDYLINNDNTSNSSKNKSARELGIPVITEVEFMEMAK